MTKSRPPQLTDWLRRAVDAGEQDAAAHPNARFTAPARQCPVIAPEWEDPKRRADQRDPVRRPPRHRGAARERGARLAARARSSARSSASEKTAAAAGKVGELRRDPMAMLPFCGYNMADYWSHWLAIGRRAGA